MRQKLFILITLLFFSFNFAFAQDLQNKTREELEAELKKIEQEITQLQIETSKISKEKNTLQNQIDILNKKIQTLNLEIQKTNYLIADLNSQIFQTSYSISLREKEINKNQEKIKLLLKEVLKQEKGSMIELVLTGNSLSDYFNNIFGLNNLSLKITKTINELKELKEELQKTMNILEEKQNEMENLLKIKELQKLETNELKNEKNNLLQITKGKEQEYQKLLSQKQKEADKIRQRIFELIGIDQAPTFGQAYEIAKYVESITGVRPAFLLAVLKQESDLGKNTGQCYLTDPNTGMGKSVASGKTLSRVMNPKRDVPIFLDITSRLQMNWKEVKVSCPMSFGWGGAMGPAQFIPSTWKLYEERLTNILGRTPNPWSVKDSFLAAGLYLKDAGADAKTYQAEWKAALKYFSGGINTRYSFYANSVMSLASNFENDIQVLEGKTYASLSAF